MRFKIFDWAGNRIGSDSFRTFDAAWEYIHGPLTDRLGLTDEDYQEYFVERADSRPACYLDPSDPRACEKIN